MSKRSPNPSPENVILSFYQEHMMSDVNFNIQPVDQKPQRKLRANRRSNKYEPIIDTFVDSGHSLVRVEGTGLDANYLRGQLIKVLGMKGIGSVEISVRNKEVYIAKR